MKKTLVICGPTATGKTSIALHLAKKIQGELVSADSRQVYKEMDIGTGKDIPEDFKYQVSSIKYKNEKIPFYSNGLKNIWGLDLVNPKEEFSVSPYLETTNLIIKDILNRGKLPILVGGTGLYIKGIVDGIGTSSMPKNESLRSQLEEKNALELFEILKEVNLEKAEMLNESDNKNPRRLIRAIEIASEESRSHNQESEKKEERDVLLIGLTANREFLYKKIETRVTKRIELGVEEEIKNLLNSGVSWDMQSMNALGYKEWREYFERKISKDEVVKKWISDEKRYAKRQMTWFKKDRRIRWFNIEDSNYISEVEREVGKWYHNKNKGI